MALDFAASLRTKMTNTAGITSLVSSSKICPMMLPQGESLPGITYQRITDIPMHAMANDVLLRNPLYQVSSWSTSYSQALSISKQIKIALQDFTGTLATNGVTVQRIFLENEIEYPDYDDITKKTSYHIAQTYRIWGTT